MSKAMVNLTLWAIDQEIETTLENCSDVSCQLYFSNPHWRQKLIAYVLRRMPGVYAVVEETEPAQLHADLLGTSIPEMSRVMQLVRQGIQYLTEAAGEEVRSPQSSDAVSACPELQTTPSTWFG